MTDRRRIEELIEASSLGTPEAKALRDSVPDEVAKRIVARSKEIERYCPSCAEQGHADCYDAGVQAGREQAADAIRIRREYPSSILVRAEAESIARGDRP